MNNNTTNKKPMLLGTSMEWRVNTGGLLKEIMEGYPGNGGIFYQPINIFRELLVKVGERAAELNDPVMNALMCRLSIYGEADPYCPDYNHDMLTKAINHPEYIKWKKTRPVS